MDFNPRERTIWHIFHFIIFWTTSAICHNLEGPQDVNTKLVDNIESYMNTTTQDRCRQFYQYSCDNWHKMEKQENLGLINIHNTTNLNYIYNQQLQQMLENGNRSNNIYNKLRNFYESCRKEKTYNVSRLLDFIKPTEQDDWPEDGKNVSASNNWNMWSTLGRMASVGFQDLFFKVDLKRSNNSLPHLKLSPRESRFSAVCSLRYPCFQSEDEKIRKMGDNIRTFCSQLNRLYTEDFDYVDMSISEFQKQFTDIDLIAYITEFLGGENIDKISISVGNLKYFHDMAELIKRKKVKLLINMLKEAFRRYLQKDLPDYTKWDHSCVHALRKFVPLAVAYSYDREVYSHESWATNATIERIFKGIQQKFQEKIEQHSDELSSEEVAILKNKLLKMRLNIGNLPAVEGDDFYTNHFQNWKVHNNYDFYRNYINALKFKHIIEVLQMKDDSPLHNITLPSAAAASTPYYQATTNSISIPFAYIRFPVIHSGLHDLFLYAELGYRISQQLLQAFNTKNIKYNANGVFVPSLNIYEKPRLSEGWECMRLIDKVHLDERYAMFDGFLLAYDTYFQQSNVQEFLGKSILNNKQLFYMKIFQLFCPNYALFDLYDLLENSPDYDVVFSCHFYSKFKKCKVW